MNEADGLLKQSLAFGSALNKIKKKPNYGQKIFRKLIYRSKPPSKLSIISTPGTPKLFSSPHLLRTIEGSPVNDHSHSLPEIPRQNQALSLSLDANEEFKETADSSLIGRSTNQEEVISPIGKETDPSFTILKQTTSKRVSGSVNQKGYLMRRKGAVGAWTDLYFVLESTFLMEYKNNTETEQPRKVINLTRSSLKYNPDITGYPFVFALTISDQNTILFQPPDEQQLVSWIQNLNNVCADSNIVWRAERMLDAFHDGVIVTSEEGMILQANEKAINILNLKREDLIGSNIESCLPNLSKEENISSNDSTQKPLKRICVERDGVQNFVYVNIGKFTVDSETKLVIALRPENETIYIRYLNERIDKIIEEATEEVCEEFKSKIREKVRATLMTPHSSAPAPPLPVSPVGPTEHSSQPFLRRIFNQGQPRSFSPSVSQRPIQKHSGILRILIFCALLVLSLVIGTQLITLPRAKSLYSINFIGVSSGFVMVSIILLYFLREEYSVYSNPYPEVSSPKLSR